MSQIVGTGIDIIEIHRIEKAMEKSLDRFQIRTFTDREVVYCEKKKFKFQHYAARFAAKEAAMKALGTGWTKGVRFTEIEVFNNDLGKPELKFTGKAKEIFQKLGATQSMLSLSHTHQIAAAMVILTE